MFNPFETASKPEQVKDLSEQELQYFDGLLKKYRIHGPKISDFADVYPAYTIKEDTKEIEQLKTQMDQHASSYDQRQKRYAEVLELLLMIFANAWLPHSRFSKVSEYDDIKRKTDLLLEISNKEEGVQRAAIDVVSGEQKSRTKITSQLENIRQGYGWTDLKYFQSQVDSDRGAKRMVRFIIGADHERVTELARMYLDFKRAPEGEERAVIANRIKNHPIKKDIHQQIADQIDSYIALTESLPNSTENGEAFVKRLRDFQSVVSNKNVPDQAASPTGNKVTAAIHESLQ
jgi:hypothetical protein